MPIPLHLLKGPVARGATGTFLLKITGTGLRFLISLALARMLGAAGYGAYSFALTCVGLLSVPALFGFDGLLVREVASYRTGSQWALLQGLMRRARRTALIASVGLGLAGAGLAWLLSAQLERALVTAFWVALLALPILTLMRIKMAIMVGLRRIVPAQLPETMVQPVFFLALLGVLATLPAGPPDSARVVGLYCVSVLVAFITAAGLLRRAQATLIRQAAPAYATGTWTRSAARFALIAGLHILGASLGIIMLGPMQGAEAIGVFGIAMAAAGLIRLPLMAINTPLAPAVSAVYSEGNKVKLQGLATKAARSAFLFCLPVALVCVVFGKPILRLFGEEFTAGYMALVILSIGPIIGAAMGSVGLLLQMTGHERDVAACVAIAIAFNILVNLGLIPLWGLSGAAVGAAGQVILLNTLLAIRVHRRLGIRPTAIG